VTKLGSVESGATGDLSGAEIKSLYEGEADTNAFDDAAVSKLGGIETGATTDQTNTQIRDAVEAATDSNTFNDVDHTKLNGIETAATADQTNNQIRDAVELATDSNTFTNADHSKLNAIEASATADQTDDEIRNALRGVLDIDTNTTIDGSDEEQVILLDPAADLTLDAVSATHVGRKYHVIVDDTSGASLIRRTSGSTVYYSLSAAEGSLSLADGISMRDRQFCTITVIAVNLWHVHAPDTAIITP
jgi:hypothetical protein